MVAGFEVHPGNWVSARSGPVVQGQPAEGLVVARQAIGRSAIRALIGAGGLRGGAEAAEARQAGLELLCEREEVTAAGARCEAERATADWRAVKAGTGRGNLGDARGRAGGNKQAGLWG